MTQPLPEEHDRDNIDCKVHSDGKGNLTVEAGIPGARAEITFSAQEGDDNDKDEFVRILPAIVDAALDTFIKTQEAQQ